MVKRKKKGKASRFVVTEVGLITEMRDDGNKIIEWADKEESGKNRTLGTETCEIVDRKFHHQKSNITLKLF